jgi:uncharacterized protein YfiM (DUF2279 family)
MKTLTKLIVILSLIVINSNASVRVSNSSWDSKDGIVFKNDKIEHLVGSSVMSELFLLYGKSKKDALVYTVAIGFAWEIKDALVPCERYGRIGGDGFCWKDFTADIAGTLLTMSLTKGNWTARFRLSNN